MSSELQPLALSDSQLDQIVRLCGPLHPQMRRLFVEHVAYALRGKVIGDGEVFRACREALRESGMFSPPIPDKYDGPHGRRTGIGKYA